ncbi:MAG: hypothetical protein AAF718_10670 [Pseudomonadota bacterium]
MSRIPDVISPRGMTRLLILSYFIAQAVGLVGETGLMHFMVPLMPDEVALHLMQGLVLGLSLLIIADIGRRHAALVLALIVFFSSYVTLYAGGELGAFWRDLALMGALLMTADITNPSGSEVDWKDIEDLPKTTRVVSKPPDSPVEPLRDQPFREDFDIARGS